MNNLTIYFPYYNQSSALKYSLDNYSNFKESTRKQLTIFIVDDGSEDEASNYITKKYLSKLNIILYRIDVDICWNQPECNNLAFSKIETDYVIRTDIDHFFDEINIDKILNRLSNQILNLDNHFYKFNRLSKTLDKLYPHPNSYIVSKKSYIKSEGYNESLSGNYGDDFDFIPRLTEIVKPTLLEDITINVNPHFCTPNMTRDASVNKKKLEDKNIQHLTFQHKDRYILKIKNIIF